MGFLNRALRGVTGEAGVERAVRRTLEEASSAAARGNTETVVTFGASEIGGLGNYSYEATTNAVVAALEQAGHSVLGVSDVGTNVSIRVRLATTAVEPSPAPPSALERQPDQTEFLPPEVQAFRALGPWATAAQVGAPFGPGHHLAEAVSAVEGIQDEHDLRMAVHSSVRMIVFDMQRGCYRFDDLDKALGWDGRRLARAAYRDLIDTTAPYKQAIADYAKHGESMIDQWLPDRAFALQLYVICNVGNRRLGHSGLTELIEL